ncbi:MAG: hypothetical protein AB1403_10435 [Candidatus Riflebacteria bacterium]
MNKSYKIQVETKFSQVDLDRHGLSEVIAIRSETIRPDNITTFSFPQLHKARETLFVQAYWRINGQYFLEIPEKYVQITDIRKVIPKSEIKNFDLSLFGWHLFDKFLHTPHTLLAFVFTYCECNNLKSFDFELSANGLEVILVDQLGAKANWLTYSAELFDEVKKVFAFYSGVKVSIIWQNEVFDSEICNSQKTISISFVRTSRKRPKYKENNWLIWFLERFIVPREYRRK